MELSTDTKDVFERLADKGLLGGVYKAVPTGEVDDEDPTFIEVLHYGKSFMAKPCMAFGSFNIPDKKWLSKYKDDITVWIAFENGNPAHAVYLGVCPEKNSPDGTPIPKVFKTTEFELTIDDSKKLLEVKRLSKDGKINFIGDNIHHGDGKEPMVLGDTLAEKMVRALELMMNIKVATAFGLSSPPINSPEIAQLKETIDEIKSSISKLD